MNQISISNPYFSNEGFAQISHHLQLLLTPDEHYLLHVFLRYMNLNNGNCHPSIRTIAKQCGWKNAKLYTVINQLIEKHVVEKNRIITKNGWRNDYKIYQFGNIETCRKVIQMLDNDDELRQLNQYTHDSLVQFLKGCSVHTEQGCSAHAERNNINNNNIKTPYNPPKRQLSEKEQLDETTDEKPTNKKAPHNPPKGDARAPDSEKPESDAEGHKGRKSQRKPKRNDTPPIDYDAFKQIWNSEFQHDAVPKIRTLTHKRKQKLDQRAKEFKEQTGYELTLERWQQLLKHLRKSRFLMGCAQPNQTWIMNFDFIVRSEQVLTRILEGTYHEKENHPS